MERLQYLVIGVGRFGSALAHALYLQGARVVALDLDESKIERIMDEVTHALIGDATDEDVLRQAGIDECTAVIVAIGANLKATILTTIAAKGLGAKRIICKATTDMGAQVLERVGADEVVRPEREMGLRLAKQLTTPALVDAFDLGTDHAVIEVKATPRLTGTLASLRLTNRFHVQVIAVNRDHDVVVSPRADYEIQPDDTLVLIGSNDAILRFRSHLAG